VTTTSTAPADADDYFTEVSVYAGVLRCTAEQLEWLGEFFAVTDPVVRTHLGSYLMTRSSDEDTSDLATEAALTLADLTEAADLLRALAGDLTQDGAA
jgi:hypothetical protein